LSRNGRLNANPAIFRQDPPISCGLFHVADTKGVDVHPHALRTVTRSLDLITDSVRNDPRANQAFLEVLTSAMIRAGAAADERSGCAGPLHPGIRPCRGADAVQHVSTTIRWTSI
jgi:hypothetical protein